MAVDDSNLYSRTKNKFNSSQNDYKSSRRSSLPPELLIGNDIRGRVQRHIKNLEPVHLRRPKKRPSIFPGAKRDQIIHWTVSSSNKNYGINKDQKFDCPLGKKSVRAKVDSILQRTKTSPK